MSEQLLASLKHSQHKVITTAIDEHTGKKYELLAVQMEREAVETLIGELQQLTPLRSRVAELEEQIRDMNARETKFMNAHKKTSTRVAELERLLANEGEMRESLASRLVGANRCIAELERLRCDCGAKTRSTLADL